MEYLSKYRLLPALLLLLSCAVGVARAEPIGLAQGKPIDFSAVHPADHTYDHWYLDTVEGKAAGYWRSSLSIEEGHLVSTYMEYSVETHGGELSTYAHRVVWTETKDFKPVRIVVTTSAGSDEVKKTYRFIDDGIELTSEQNGRTIKRTLAPIKGDYLTAAQSSITIDLNLKRGVESFRFNALDVSMGMTPFVTTYTRSKEKPAKLKLADGGETQAQGWVTTYAIFPGFEMKNWVDESNVLVGLAYDIDAVTFESRLADASVAETEFDPPELSGLSVVRPDRPIKNVDQQTKIVYELSYQAGGLDIVPVSTAKQSVEALGKGKAKVTVDLDAKPRAALKDRPTKAHLASSIMIDHEDKIVRKLAKQAAAKLPDDASTVKTAKACKRFVTRHVSGASLSVGDGSASEAARTQEGDCTECSVLLAALLRVHNIPSRCVSGLVYSEDDFVGQEHVFVYHQWTQAWIEGEDGKGYWLDLDSAMWRYSAGHIALGVSAMGDDDQQDLIDLVPMQQELTIKIKQTSK
ncbi:MAG: transglutaminase-like domain-containing protein [Phycisphaeraceae bacterium]|nr:transglutaminase-like domain-containing protein [Phycisphaeraceae bacterium]